MVHNRLITGKGSKTGCTDLLGVEFLVGLSPGSAERVH